ncbi:MAG: hypothetical protein ABSC89_01125 [Verrucomicrobiota bacterium]
MSVSEAPNRQEIGVLLRGELEPIIAWTGWWNARRFVLHIAVIIVGAGLYGAALGWWRDPQQALFTALKFPLIILLTTAANALLNAMLAPLLGLNIPFRQSFSAILMSFVIAAAILGAFSPLLAFLIWNAPPMSSATPSESTYNFIKLTQVAVIAFAGVTGNVRLFQLLSRLGAAGRSPAACCLHGWRATCFSAASFRGFCARSSARHRCRWNFSARPPCTEIFMKMSSTRCCRSSSKSTKP